MKILLAMVSGFVFTLAIFAGGGATAVWMMTGKPIPDRMTRSDASELWTNEPVTVRAAAREELERLPARPSRDHAPIETAASDDDAAFDDGAMIDTMTTAAISPETDARTQGEPSALDIAHLEWCASRYRSYDPRDNSYNPYRGGRRECVSPYSEGEVAVVQEEDRYAGPSGSGTYALVSSAYADEGPGHGVTEEHISYCFSRYRSYRVEDNSYQPYGGGPRQQCR